MSREVTPLSPAAVDALRSIRAATGGRCDTHEVEQGLYAKVTGLRSGGWTLHYPGVVVQVWTERRFVRQPVLRGAAGVALLLVGVVAGWVLPW